jgi:hypothetical protein
MATEDEPHRFQTFVEEAIVDPKGGVLVIGIQHVFSQAYFFSATTAAGIPVASGVTMNYTYGGGRAGGHLAVQGVDYLGRVENLEGDWREVTDTFLSSNQKGTGFKSRSALFLQDAYTPHRLRRCSGYHLWPPFRPSTMTTPTSTREVCSCVRTSVCVLACLCLISIHVRVSLSACVRVYACKGVVYSLTIPRPDAIHTCA